MKIAEKLDKKISEVEELKSLKKYVENKIKKLENEAGDLLKSEGLEKFESSVGKITSVTRTNYAFPDGVKKEIEELKNSAIGRGDCEVTFSNYIKITPSRKK